MASTTAENDHTGPPAWLRGLLLVAGLVVAQFVLYAPSLLGWRILLPLDILASPKRYIAGGPEMQGFRPQNWTFSDQVVQHEIWRRFAVSEVRAGRLPLWNPYNYCGSPFVAANQSAVFSPFRILDYLFPGPVTIAWVQMARALVGGIGAYFFFRLVLGASYWPSASIAWCYPLTGYLVLWLGWPLSSGCVWFPWMLLAVDRAVRRPGGFGGPLLAIVTAASLLAGHSAVAAHMLVACGLFFLWSMADQYGIRKLASIAAVASTISVVCGWGIGILLASPQNLPTAEYMRSSLRIARRPSDTLELPAVGLWVLPQYVWPNFYGSDQRESVYLIGGNRQEGAPSAYAGLLLTLCLAPLAACDKRRRWLVIFLIAWGIFGSSVMLAIPGLKELFNYFPLNTLRNNRFVFVTAFAVMSLAVLGLEALRTRQCGWRKWFWAPLTLAACFGLWCLARGWSLPESVTKEISAAVFDPIDATQTALWFRQMYLVGALFSGLAVAWWLAIKFASSARKRLATGLIALALAEFLWFAWDVNPQTDPALYYPPVAALDKIKSLTPGRICGVLCLPPCLNQAACLSDIRGYDGADPIRMITLLGLAQSTKVNFPQPPYAVTQWYVPGDSPILDMLNLRYVIHRDPYRPGVKPLFEEQDYWIEERPNALPRVFVPEHVTVLNEEKKILQSLSASDFEPRRVAYVQQQIDLPERCTGTAEITSETPGEVRISFDMQTSGLVVLADLWDPGWTATVNGHESDVLITNHAIRGVVVPSGQGEIVLRYEPSSFWQGVRLAQFGGVLLALWLILAALSSRHSSSADAPAVTRA